MKIFNFFLFFASLFSSLFGDHIVWETPVTLSSTGIDSVNPNIAIDPYGNIIAVWIENGVLKSKFRADGQDWGSSLTISGSGATTPCLVMDTTGKATVIWVEAGLIKTSSKSLGQNWETPITLSSSGASSPDLALGSQDDLVAVWVRSGQIETLINIGGGSWPGTPSTISSEQPSNPKVAIGGEGTIIVVWETIISTTNRIASSSCAVDIGDWSEEEIISEVGIESFNPRIAVDPNGNALSIWSSYIVSGGIYSNFIIKYAMKPFELTWISSKDLTDPGFFIPQTLFSKVLFDPLGNGFAAWVNSYDGTSLEFEGCTFHSDEITQLGTINTCNNLYAGDIALTTGGLAIAVYQANSYSKKLVINCGITDLNASRNRYWTGGEALSTGTLSGDPKVALSTNDEAVNACCVWIYYDGSNKIIQSTTGLGETVSPPTNLTVSQVLQDKTVFSEYCNIIEWEEPTSEGMAGYFLYRNDFYLGFIPAGTTKFIDHNRVQNGPITYKIASVARNNLESDLVSVSFP